MRPADRAWLARQGEAAWIALFGGVLTWNLFCRPGHMLSEAADRHPWIARGAGAAIYLHVANLIPQRVDPIHRAFAAVRQYVAPRHIIEQINE